MQPDSPITSLTLLLSLPQSFPPATPAFSVVSNVPGIFQFRILHLPLATMPLPYVITDLEPDILECEVKWALERITMNKASGDDGIPVELFQT